MATTGRFAGGWLTLLATMALASTVGCSTLQTGPQVDLDQQVVAEPDRGREVVVELRDGDGHREHLKAPLKGPMLVQDALKGSGAIQRFRRMNVVLVRQVPNGKTLRMPVRFDPSKRQVAADSNYALMVGDTLEVTRDTSTTLDRMIDAAMEPLRPMMRSRSRHY